MSSSANQKPIFSKILVAIDGSDVSMDAADYATAISQRYNAELYALHVIHADVDLPHVTSVHGWVPLNTASPTTANPIDGTYRHVES